MDPILQAFLSFNFVLFCLAVVAATFVIRRVIEFGLLRIKDGIYKNSKLWADVIVPILPVVLGSVGGLLLKQYPYPTGFGTISGRFIFGMVAGLLSTLVYRIIKAVIFSKVKDIQPAAAEQINQPSEVDKPLINTESKEENK